MSLNFHVLESQVHVLKPSIKPVDLLQFTQSFSPRHSLTPFVNLVYDPYTYYVFSLNQGATKRTALLVGLLLVPLYISRAIYNLVAISKQTITTFGYSWINVSDQVR